MQKKSNKFKPVCLKKKIYIYILVCHMSPVTKAKIHCHRLSPAMHYAQQAGSLRQTFLFCQTNIFDQIPQKNLNTQKKGFLLLQFEKNIRCPKQIFVSKFDPEADLLPMSLCSSLPASTSWPLSSTPTSSSQESRDSTCGTLLLHLWNNSLTRMEQFSNTYGTIL